MSAREEPRSVAVAAAVSLLLLDAVVLAQAKVKRATAHVTQPCGNAARDALASVHAHLFYRLSANENMFRFHLTRL